MGSHYSQLKKESTLGSINTKRLTDFDETDPYYFVAKVGEKIVAEGELPLIKLKLPDEFLYRPIKQFTRNRETMVAYLQY